jgi:hypothetical protein
MLPAPPKNEKDHAALKRAIRDGTVDAVFEKQMSRSRRRN